MQKLSVPHSVKLIIETFGPYCSRISLEHGLEGPEKSKKTGKTKKKSKSVRLAQVRGTQNSVDTTAEAEMPAEPPGLPLEKPTLRKIPEFVSANSLDS